MSSKSNCLRQLNALIGFVVCALACVSRPFCLASRIEMWCFYFWNINYGLRCFSLHYNSNRSLMIRVRYRNRMQNRNRTKCNSLCVYVMCLERNKCDWQLTYDISVNHFEWINILDSRKFVFATTNIRCELTTFF